MDDFKSPLIGINSYCTLINQVLISYYLYHVWEFWNMLVAWLLSGIDRWSSGHSIIRWNMAQWYLSINYFATFLIKEDQALSYGAPLDGLLNAQFLFAIPLTSRKKCPVLDNYRMVDPQSKTGYLRMLQNTNWKIDLRFQCSISGKFEN